MDLFLFEKVQDEKGKGKMKEFTYVITDPQGIHARPAGVLVKAAASFSSKVTITKDDKSVDAKRILAIMGLGIKEGHQIKVTIEGEDEEKAAIELQELLKNNL